jgi:acyl-CoA hydrolase
MTRPSAAPADYYQIILGSGAASGPRRLHGARSRLRNVKRATRVVAPESLDFRDIVRPGDMVVWGQAAAEPSALTQRLLAQRSALGSFEAFIGMTWSDTTDLAVTDHIAFTSYCGTAKNRCLGSKLSILPLHYSQLATVLSDREPILLLQMNGNIDDAEYSFGAAAEYLADLAPRARCVIAQINQSVPRTHGARLARNAIDILVPFNESMTEPPAMATGDVERRIAKRVADLIEDGAVLQLGLGSIPAAVLGALGAHRDLGVHSGLIIDQVADLTEAGVITNAHKRQDCGSTVTGILAGGPRLMRWAHNNLSLRLAPTSYTHNPDILARHDRFTAVNSALEVDLSGQINAEVAAGRYVGAVGGGAEFLRAARRSYGGMPIVALPAAAGDLSRIVRNLGNPVSTSRADVGIVVTEYGVADLRKATLSQRRERLLAIAAPDHRAALDLTA